MQGFSLQKLKNNFTYEFFSISLFYFVFAVCHHPASSRGCWWSRRLVFRCSRSLYGAEVFHRSQTNPGTTGLLPELQSGKTDQLLHSLGERSKDRWHSNSQGEGDRGLGEGYSSKPVAKVCAINSHHV